MRRKLSAKEAAAILGVSVQQVYRYHKTRVLVGTSSNFSLQFDEADVDALREAGGASLEVTHKGLLIERARRIALERRVDLLERLLGVAPSTLVTLSEDELLQLLDSARAALRSPPTDALTLMDWANTLADIQDEFLDLVHAQTGNPDPWDPFLRLADALYAVVPKKGDVEATEALHQVALARAGLRRVVFAYVTRTCSRAQASRVIKESGGSLMAAVNARVTPGR